MLKAQAFSSGFPVGSPIAVSSPGLQDVTSPGVVGPTEGQGF